MLPYALTPTVEANLRRDIVRYTLRQWGERQARRYVRLNWLQVLGYAEPPQIDECVGHQLHAIVPTLMVLEPQQQPLQFVLPGKRPFDSVP